MANLGITLPIERGNSGNFAQGRDVLSQVRSNLTNLILTRKGERPMQPDFGSDIYAVIFEPITDNILSEIRGAVDSAVKIWMPYVSVETVAVDRDEDRNKISATITFSINTSVTITDSVTLIF